MLERRTIGFAHSGVDANSQTFSNFPRFKWPINLGWPGTESNRRRRPFHGRLPNRIDGLKSTDPLIITSLRHLHFRLMQARLGCFGYSMFAYCSRDNTLCLAWLTSGMACTDSQ